MSFFCLVDSDIASIRVGHASKIIRRRNYEKRSRAAADGFGRAKLKVGVPETGLKERESPVSPQSKGQEDI